MKNIAIFLFISCFLYGCAETNLTSFTDPSYRNREYGKVIIHALTTNLNEEESIENEFVYELNYSDLHGVSYLQLFPPLREYSDSVVLSVLKQNGIDAMLFFSPSSKGSTEYLETPSSSLDGTLNYYAPWATFSAGLYDVTSFAAFLSDTLHNKMYPIWKASGESSGGKYTGQSTLTTSYVRKIIGDLLENGLINSPERKKRLE